MISIDYDLNGTPDLIVVGEWLPISVFSNSKGKFINQTQELGLANTKGWWNTIEAIDINDDSYPDLIGGNWGLNSKLKASIEKPLTLYINDFDNNGSIESILCIYEDKKLKPMHLKTDIASQIGNINRKYLKYAEYATEGIEDIFDKKILSKSTIREVTMLSSSLFINQEGTEFIIHELPIEAQFSPIYAITTIDIDKDKDKDIIIAGNFYGVKPERGNYDASYGLVLENKQSKLIALPSTKTGFLVKGEIRDIEQIIYKSKSYIIASRNNNSLKVFEIKL